jgi:hypothetical protein
MSPSSLRTFASDAGVEIARRGRQAEVDWADTEAVMARSRVTRVDEALQRMIDPERVIRGIELLDAVRQRFDWSDQDIALALTVWPSAVSRWRINGVPDEKALLLRDDLSKFREEVRAPRRVQRVSAAEMRETRRRAAGRWSSR